MAQANSSIPLPHIGGELERYSFPYIGGLRWGQTDYCACKVIAL